MPQANSSVADTVNYKDARNLLKLIKQTRTSNMLGGLVWALGEGKLSQKTSLGLAQAFFEATDGKESEHEQTLIALVSEKFLQLVDVIPSKLDEFSAWHKEVTSFAHQFREELHELEHASHEQYDFPVLKRLLAPCHAPGIDTGQLVDDWRTASGSSKKELEDRIVSVADRNQHIIKQPHFIKQVRSDITLYQAKDDEIELSRNDINEMMSYAARGVGYEKTAKEQLQEQDVKIRKLEQKNYILDNEKERLSGNIKGLGREKKELDDLVKRYQRDEKRLSDELQKTIQEYNKYQTENTVLTNENKILVRKSEKLATDIYQLETNLKEAEDFKRKLDATANKLSEKSMQLSKLEKELEQAKNAPKEDSKRVAELTGKVSKYEEDIRALGEQLKTQSEESGKLAEKATGFERKFNILLDDYSKTVMANDTETKKRTEELAKLTKEYERLRTSYSELEQDRQDSAEQIIDLQFEEAEQTKEIGDLKIKYRATRKHIEKVRKVVAAKGKALSQGKLLIDRLTKELFDEKNKSQADAENIGYLEAQIKNYKTEVDTRNQQLTETQAYLKTQENNATKLTEQYAALANDQNLLKEKLRLYVDDNTLKEETITTLRKESEQIKTEYQNRITQAESDANVAKTELEKKGELIVELQTQLNTEQKKSEKDATKITDLEGQIEYRQTEIKSLQKQLAENDEHLGKLKTDFSNFETTYKQLVDKHDKTDQRLALYLKSDEQKTEQLGKLQEDNKSLKGLVEKHSKDKTTLENNIKGLETNIKRLKEAATESQDYKNKLDKEQAHTKSLEKTVFNLNKDLELKAYMFEQSKTYEKKIESRLSVLGDEIKQLEQERDNAKELYEEAVKSKDSEKSMTDTLRKALRSKENELENLKRSAVKTGKLKGQIYDLNVQLEKSRNSELTYKSELVTLIADTKSSIAKLDCDHSEKLNKQNTYYLRALKGLEQQLGQQLKKYETIEAEVGELQKDKQRLTQALSETESEKQQLEQKFSDLGASASALRDECERYAKQGLLKTYDFKPLSKTRRALIAAGALVAIIGTYLATRDYYENKSELTPAYGTIESGYKSQLGEKETKIKELNEKFTKREEEIVELKQAHAKEITKKDYELANVLETRQKEADACNKRLGSCEAQANQLKTELTRVEDKFGKLGTALYKALDKNDKSAVKDLFYKLVDAQDGKLDGKGAIVVGGPGADKAFGKMYDAYTTARPDYREKFINAMKEIFKPYAKELEKPKITFGIPTTN